VNHAVFLRYLNTLIVLTFIRAFWTFIGKSALYQNNLRRIRLFFVSIRNRHLNSLLRGLGWSRLSSTLSRNWESYTQFFNTNTKYNLMNFHSYLLNNTPFWFLLVKTFGHKWPQLLYYGLPNLWNFLPWSIDDYNKWMHSVYCL
jgi:hypothetical protein